MSGLSPRHRRLFAVGALLVSLFTTLLGLYLGMLWLISFIYVEALVISAIYLYLDRNR